VRSIAIIYCLEVVTEIKLFAIKLNKKKADKLQMMTNKMKLF